MRDVEAFARAGLLGLALLAVGCTAPSFDPLCKIPQHGTPAEKEEALCRCQGSIMSDSVQFPATRKLDVLFVIGNTRGMVAKQRALLEIFRQQLWALGGNDTDLHVGVISTDVGSWTAADTPWTMSSGTCDSFEGDDGRLQARSCLDRSGISASAATTCAALCPDRKYLPNDGRPYIAWERGKLNVPPALEIDSKTGLPIDRGPEYAFQCLAFLGDGGCEISSPLESLRRALDGHRLENSGFRRPKAALVVILLSDRDDCSVKLDRRADNDPHTQNCAMPDADAPPRCYGLGAYRCLARDVRCSEPMNVAGAKTGCQERSDSYLESVEEYVQFLKTLVPQTRLMVLTLASQPGLAEGGKLVVAQSPVVAGSAGLEMASGSDASCQSAQDPNITGQAQLRLSKFAASFPEYNGFDGSIRKNTSVCDTDRYAAAVAPLFFTILRGFGPACFARRPSFDAEGRANCLVGDVPENDPNALPEVLMPMCSPGCCAAFAASQTGLATDSNVRMHCATEPADCYCTFLHRNCEFGSDVSAAFGVWRKDDADPPPEHVTTARCAVQCGASP